MPVGSKRKLGLDEQDTALIVAEKRLLARAGPLARTADTLRRPCNQCKFGEKSVARAEIAADFVRGDAHCGGWHLKNPGKLLLLPDDAAAAGVKPIATARRIVAGNCRARLHRNAGHALDPCLEPNDVCRPGKRFRGGSEIASIGVDAYVCKVVVERWSARLHCGARAGDGRQGLVMDFHAFRR